MSSNEKELSFNKIEIDKKIENKDFKKKQEIVFDFIDVKMKKKDNQKYIADIKKGNERYIGVLTEDFKRDLFGYSLFNEGDEYIGEILEEKKNGFGIYSFKKENNIQDLYIGNFENNMINGKGVYINILNKEEIKKTYNLEKYNCYIGEFEKGKFKKGKIYIFNQNFEKLTFQNEEEHKEDNSEISIEKHNEIILVSKSIKKNGIVFEGFIININNKDEIENKYSFKSKKDSGYTYENVNNELNEKELFDIYNKNKDNFKQYNKIIQKVFNEALVKLNNIKRNIVYAKSQEIEKEYKNYFENKIGNILFL